jgi:predicted dehydrogenase
VSARRVGVVGARRARQGLGPFVIRDLRAAGAEVPCFLATTETTLHEATTQLARSVGTKVRGYLEIDAMLAAERLDALAILSPHETHRTYLEAALATGLHALCEKPLLWGVRDLAASAASLAARFQARELLLWENCQWPYTLPAFERLHPGTLGAPPRHFAMLLQPAGRGVQMLADSLPHPLSLLQALAPGPSPSLGDVRFSSTDPEAASVFVRFVYRAGHVEVQTEVELRPTEAHPRETRIEIDGRPARRLVSPHDYRLTFDAGGRAVALDDPLALLVSDFVSELQRDVGERSALRGREIIERMSLLEEIVAAYERAGT